MLQIFQTHANCLKSRVLVWVTTFAGTTTLLGNSAVSSCSEDVWAMPTTSIRGSSVKSDASLLGVLVILICIFFKLINVVTNQGNYLNIYLGYLPVLRY